MSSVFWGSAPPCIWQMPRVVNCSAIRKIWHACVSKLPQTLASCCTVRLISKRNVPTGSFLDNSSYIIMQSKSWQQRAWLEKMERKTQNWIRFNFFLILLVFCYFQVSVWKIWNASILYNDVIAIKIIFKIFPLSFSLVNSVINWIEALESDPRQKKRKQIAHHLQ